MSEPERITLEHILIQAGDHAEEKARKLFEEAKSGADFSALMKEHSEDPGGTSYSLLNNGVEGTTFQDHIMELNGKAAEKEQELGKQVQAGTLAVEEAEKHMHAFVESLQEQAAQADLPYPRSAMVPAFGDIGFALAEGEIGLAEHHEENSPFGWHIIKRTA